MTLVDGLVLGITTRAMGSMKVEENRRRALETFGLAGRPLYTCKQVHGTDVVRAPFQGQPEGDGVIADAPDIAVGVYMADCLPIFLWRPGAQFGVFHSGWRGTALGMPKAAVAALGGPKDLKAWIGPHIGPCCFAAREDCTSRFPRSSVVARAGSTYVDLFADAVRQLREAGVTPPAERPACTSCSREEYFSFRRDKVGNSLLAVAARKAA